MCQGTSGADVAAPGDLVRTAPGAPELRVAVDPRVELFSIVFRLAGHPEYNRARIESYRVAVEEQFGRFGDHPVVRRARRLRRERGVSFDAVMGLAIHLKDAESLALLTPLDPWPEALDTRWTKPEVEGFLAELRDFAQASDFAAFLQRQRPLFELAEARMRAMLSEHTHLEWFPAFFGPAPGGPFTVVVALLNGPNHYGPRCRLPDGSERLYAILGSYERDAQGNPVFGPNLMELVVHEFTHSYANPWVDRHEAELKEAGEALYRPVAEAMRRQAYGTWQTMLREMLVRACTLRYIARHAGDQAAMVKSADEVQRAFLHVPALARVLAEYEMERERYPNLEAFTPRLLSFLRELAERQKAEATSGTKR
jgi:hypothetical protein